MKRLVLAVVTAASVLLIPEALSFQPGERVRVGSRNNQTGTVLEDTGKLVKVHLDDSGYSSDVGVWYDKDQDKVSNGTGGATGPSASDTIPGAQVYSVSGPNSFKPGERIRVGSISKTGTVLEDTGKLVKIHLDDSGYSSDVGVWFDKEQLKDPRSAGVASVPSASGSTGGARIGLGAQGSMTQSPQQRLPSVSAATQINKSTGDPSQNAPVTNADKTAGAPPDGIYQCNKISVGKYIHIGTIEIRGRTYKGFSSQQGSFHPFTMDGSGNIVWTGGLTGFPDGWTLKPAKYVGLDYKGHPLLRIYYTSARGAAEVIDAVKEK